jgi:hypothetical protein
MRPCPSGTASPLAAARHVDLAALRIGLPSAVDVGRRLPSRAARSLRSVAPVADPRCECYRGPHLPAASRLVELVAPLALRDSDWIQARRGSGYRLTIRDDRVVRIDGHPAAIRRGSSCWIQDRPARTASGYGWIEPRSQAYPATRRVRPNRAASRRVFATGFGRRSGMNPRASRRGGRFLPSCIPPTGRRVRCSPPNPVLSRSVSGEPVHERRFRPPALTFEPEWTYDDISRPPMCSRQRRANWPRNRPDRYGDRGPGRAARRPCLGPARSRIRVESRTSTARARAVWSRLIRGSVRAPTAPTADTPAGVR